MELVPLKVKIGLKLDNSHDYPPFNDIDPEFRDYMDWSYYIDKFGGWHYDKIAGHVDNDEINDSPIGTWLGIFLVSDAFAQAAIALWPDRCSILIEAEAESFYNNRAHAREPKIFEDVEVLQAIVARRELGILDDDDITNALNPDHPQNGRRRNPNKTWANYKVNRGIIIKV